MNLQGIGIILVITGCGGFGFSMAAAYRREVSLLNWSQNDFIYGNIVDDPEKEKHLAQELENGFFGLTPPERVHADLAGTAEKSRGLAHAAQQRVDFTAAILMLVLGAVFLLAGLALTFVIKAFVSLPIAAIGAVLLSVMLPMAGIISSIL